jgi:ADP-dependent NAD(P)H-hydrate dehydratase / NAD(P)H-hydrate epimerase
MQNRIFPRLPYVYRFDMAGLPLFGIEALRAHEVENRNAQLMERAGTAAAEWLIYQDPSFARALIVAGPGNNGGDAFVMARVLLESGKAVTVVALALPREDASDAQRAYEALVATGVPIEREMPQAGFQADWVVDGVFGIGLNRAPEASYRAVIERINQFRVAHGGRTKILSLDVPSGVDAQTGYAFEPSVIADYTLTFLARKPGLYTGMGLEFVGEIVLLDLGLGNPGSKTDGLLIHWPDVANALPWRRRTSHKGDAGTLMVVGGAQGMVGAPMLSARAASRAGAGKVQVGFITNNTAQITPLVDMLAPELMFAPFSKFPEKLSAVVIGPGLGLNAAATDALGQALRLSVPIVLDADALTLISQNTGLADRVRARTSPTLLTPHPGEASRLLHISTEDVNADRIACARSLSEQLRAHVVLKGAGSVCVNTNGATSINATGNPLLATAGMGDVLAGIISALLAQGMQPFHALVVGVAWHGHLADTLAGRGRTRIVASDVITVLGE